RRHGATVTAIAISPEGQLLASAAEDGVLAISSLASGAELLRLRQAAPARRLVLVPGQGLLVSADGEGIVRVWELRRRRATRSVGRTARSTSGGSAEPVRGTHERALARTSRGSFAVLLRPGRRTRRGASPRKDGL